MSGIFVKYPIQAVDLHRNTLTIDSRVIDRIVKMYKKDLTPKQIAAEVGLSDVTIYKILKKRGVTLKRNYAGKLYE